MKFSAIFLTFCAFFTYSSHHSLSIEVESNNLANYACTIAKQALKSQQNTQDILIINNILYMESNLINLITGCIPKDNPIVLHNLRMPLTEKTLRKASLVVLLSDALSPVSITMIFDNF